MRWLCAWYQLVLRQRKERVLSLFLFLLSSKSSSENIQSKSSESHRLWDNLQHSDRWISRIMEKVLIELFDMRKACKVKPLFIRPKRLWENLPIIPHPLLLWGLFLGLQTNLKFPHCRDDTLRYKTQKNTKPGLFILKTEECKGRLVFLCLFCLSSITLGRGRTRLNCLIKVSYVDWEKSALLSFSHLCEWMGMPRMKASLHT